MSALNKTPQVYLIGCIKSSKEFDSDRMYIKYEFKVGEDWKKISGLDQGESFECVSDNQDDPIPIEQPFDLNYTAKTIKGWPKLIMEAWEVDCHGRNKIAGYGIVNIPFSNGTYTLDAHCWRPKPSYYDKIVGVHPELEYRDMLLASQTRASMPTESTGVIEVQVSVILNGFELHGCEM